METLNGQIQHQNVENREISEFEDQAKEIMPVDNGENNWKKQQRIYGL